MSYRPEGWETLKAKNHPLHCLFPDECVGQSYEAGADAMLKALREQGMPPYYSENIQPPCERPSRGTLVFIPDD